MERTDRPVVPQREEQSGCNKINNMSSSKEVPSMEDASTSCSRASGSSSSSMESAMALLEGMLVVLDDSPSDAANVPDIEQALSGPPTREESSFGMQERPLPTLASHRVHIDPESAPEVVEASYTSAKVCCGVTAVPHAQQQDSVGLVGGNSDLQAIGFLSRGTDHAPAPTVDAVTDQAPATTVDAVTDHGPATTVDAVTDQAPAMTVHAVTDQAPAMILDALTDKACATISQSVTDQTSHMKITHMKPTAADAVRCQSILHMEPTPRALNQHGGPSDLGQASKPVDGSAVAADGSGCGQHLLRQQEPSRLTREESPVQKSPKGAVVVPTLIPGSPVPDVGCCPSPSSSGRIPSDSGEPLWYPNSYGHEPGAAINPAATSHPNTAIPLSTATDGTMGVQPMALPTPPPSPVCTTPAGQGATQLLTHCSGRHAIAVLKGAQKVVQPETVAHDPERDGANVELKGAPTVAPSHGKELASDEVPPVQEQPKANHETLSVMRHRDSEHIWIQSIYMANGKEYHINLSREPSGTTSLELQSFPLREVHPSKEVPNQGEDNKNGVPHAQLPSPCPAVETVLELIQASVKDQQAIGVSEPEHPNRSELAKHASSASQACEAVECKDGLTSKSNGSTPIPFFGGCSQFTNALYVEWPEEWYIRRHALLVENFLEDTRGREITLQELQNGFIDATRDFATTWRDLTWENGSVSGDDFAAHLMTLYLDQSAKLKQHAVGPLDDEMLLEFYLKQSEQFQRILGKQTSDALSVLSELYLKQVAQYAGYMPILLAYKIRRFQRKQFAQLETFSWAGDLPLLEQFRAEQAKQFWELLDSLLWNDFSDESTATPSEVALQQDAQHSGFAA